MLQITYCSFQQWKNFQNQLRDEVIAKSLTSYFILFVQGNLLLWTREDKWNAIRTRNYMTKHQYHAAGNGCSIILVRRPWPRFQSIPQQEDNQNNRGVDPAINSLGIWDNISNSGSVKEQCGVHLATDNLISRNVISKTSDVTEGWFTAKGNAFCKSRETSEWRIGAISCWGFVVGISHKTPPVTSYLQWWTVSLGHVE